MNKINQSYQSRSAILVERYSILSPFAGGSLRILSFIGHNGQQLTVQEFGYWEELAAAHGRMAPVEGI